MNAELLLKHFARISEAPDAIPSLRKFILDLAIRGKLVEQDPGDGPAGELVEHIWTERHRLSKAGTIKNDWIRVGIKNTEIPYSLPHNWEWIRLGDGLAMINGRAFKPTEWLLRGLPIVRIQNLNSDNAAFNYCDETTVEEKHVIDTGSFLISWSGTPGTSFGAFIWNRGRAALNQHIFKCFQIGDPYYDRFLQIAINGRLDEMIARAHGGVGLQHITKGKLENLTLCLPPFAEQQRIVSRFDELMALCNQLETRQAEREKVRRQMAVASLHHLDSRGDKIAFCERAAFCLTHFSQITHHQEQIPALRHTILNLAMQGKLVTQEPNDEPAKQLLSQIQAEKVELIRGHGRKREADKLHLLAEDVPFDLPSSWAWTPLHQLIVFGPQNGISPKPSSRPDAPRAITLTATTKGVFDSRHFKGVEASISPDSEFWLRPGDLLFQRGNTREYVGMAAYYSGEPGVFLYPDLMMKVRLSEKVHLPYIHHCTIAPHSRAHFSSHASGAQSTMPKINQGILLGLPIPLPPLAEQRRIAAKIGELMGLCDELEVHLSRSADTSRALLESVLHHALFDALPISMASVRSCQ